ncbi:MAG: phenylalanine--tRNA ligase subunit beta [Bacteroidetes bacterium]|nr:phenylalanine--tRNA ligase subunit beta [Bacteroidota bacterium]
MKVAYNWLRTLADFKATPAELDSLLTRAGLEVEHIETWESVRGGLRGLLIGKVLEVKPHPNADRLRCTLVDVGGAEPLPIVCGAANLAAGQKVVVATVGATLHPFFRNPFEIKETKIRGERSCGMICAEDEIGLGSSHEGIMVLPENAPVGQDFALYHGVEEDVVLDIGLTPNRGDAASHRGIIRELKAHIPVTEVNITLPEPSGNPVLNVQVEAPELCSVYMVLPISGVTVKPSPQWLKNRLLSIGINPINNIVDATNFVLHETGQPIHAFDRSKIHGDTLSVRLAKQGELLTTLDKQERKMKGGELVIADGQKLLALAGVFGGQDTGVSENTHTIVLESACFHPGLVRKTARTHGLSTDASFRFERGTDPEACRDALLRVAGLIVELAGGHIEGTPGVFEQKPEPRKVQLRDACLRKIAGGEIPRSRVVEILKQLGMQPEENAGAVQVSIPSWRHDISLEIDLVEEVLRVYGYDEIPMPGKIHMSLTSGGQRLSRDAEQRMREYLTAHGFHEMMSNSLSASAYYPEEAQAKLVHLSNPLSSDLDVMRGSLVYQALEAVAYNRNRQSSRIRLFELGKVYEKTPEGSSESWQLMMVSAGDRWPETWELKQMPSGPYDLKTVAQGLLRKLGQTDMEIPVQSVDRKLLDRFGINIPVHIAIFPWEELMAKMKETTFRLVEPSRFPLMRRDLSLVLPPGCAFDRVETLIRNHASPIMREYRLFDVYEGKPLEPGQKSYAISFQFGLDERTLTDTECDEVMQRYMKVFEQELQAQIRR